jgi:hypothetical protein
MATIDLPSLAVKLATMPFVVLIAAVVVTVLAVLQFAGRIRAFGVEFTVGLALSLWAVWFFARHVHG